MNNKMAGTILLATAGFCCTLGMVGAQIAGALNRGLWHAGNNSGRIPIGLENAKLGWVIGLVVLFLGMAGLVLLLTRDQESG